jgi:colicin import membrane protein
MQQLLSSLEDERQRQFRRFVKISAVIHAGLAVLAVIGPMQRSSRHLPVVERVELVEALVPAARPAPAPARPAPARPKPPPPPAKKILPKEPAPLPKPKPAEAKPKPEPRVEPKPEPKPAEEPAPEQDYEDVLADLRKEVGETAPAPQEQAAAAPAGGPVGGPGIVDPLLARWQREVKIHVTRAWIVPAGFRSEALVTEVEVELSATGDVLGTRKTKGSGNPWFDESVERAIEKASPLPAPPEAGEWPFRFDSREMQ